MGWLKTPLVLVGFFCSFPLMALGWFAPLICVVWLLALGQWGLLLLGLALGFIVPTVIALIIGGGLGALMALKAPRVVLRLGAGALQLVTFALIVLYGIWAFAIALQHRGHGSLWPYLLWAYATGITPWQAIASKAPKGDAGAVVWCSTAQFGGAAMLVALGSGTYYGSGAYFIAGAILGALVGYAAADERSSGLGFGPTLKPARG